MDKMLLNNEIGMLYDNFFSNNIYEDISLDKLDIIHIFGREKLEQVQRILSNTTGLAFVTVDFKGDVITEETNFSSFCKNIRKESFGLQRCKSSDAFGSIQASVTQTANIYFCPCGLIDVAIPIIIHGHYLGGFIGGQVRCNDAPDEICNLKTIMPSKGLDEFCNNYKDLFNEIPIFPYEKLRSIVSLVQLVVNQLGENLLLKKLSEKISTSKLLEAQNLNTNLNKELIKVKNELNELRSSTDLYSTLEIITLITNLSVIEKAPKTESTLYSLSEYIKYTHQTIEAYSTLQNEFNNIENYLSLQKIKYNDKLNYSIKLDDGLKFKKIQTKVLFPFIKNALYNGVLLNENGGCIDVAAERKNNKFIITISDDGPGLTNEELNMRFEDYSNKHEGYYIKLGLESSIKKLKDTYGNKFEFKMKIDKDSGREYKFILNKKGDN